LLVRRLRRRGRQLRRISQPDRPPHSGPRVERTAVRRPRPGALADRPARRRDPEPGRGNVHQFPRPEWRNGEDHHSDQAEILRTPEGANEARPDRSGRALILSATARTQGSPRSGMAVAHSRRLVMADSNYVSPARAVAEACAANPVAILIPCHRVIRADGSLGGYRWGAKRKARLLERERASA